MTTTAAALCMKAAVKRYGADIQTLLAVQPDDADGDAIADIGTVRPSYLESIEDELRTAYDEIEHIARAARDMTGANPAIDGDDDDFVRLDAESAWHLSSFARMLRLKAEELVECANWIESSAYFGWQNKLDADEKIGAAQRRVAAIRLSNLERPEAVEA